MIKQNEEASKAFLKAIEVIRTCIVFELQRNGNTTVTLDTSYETLVQPSIFDNQALKDLKDVMGDLLSKIQETSESKQIEEQLKRLKKEEGEQVKVDANFGKVQANADQFQDVTLVIKKKRTHEEMIKSSTSTEVV